MMSLFSSSSWLLLLLPVCQACTVFIVGREASADGSVMVSHSVRHEYKVQMMRRGFFRSCKNMNAVISSHLGHPYFTFAV